MKQEETEKRMETVKQLVSQRRQMTMEYYKWMSTPREYFPGDSLYMREAHIIVEIGPDGIDNVSRLGEKLKITQGAVSQQLGKLEKKGYLVRIQDQNDKRQYAVRLTEKGRALYERHQKYDDRRYEQILPLFDSFSEEDLEVVRRFDRQFEEILQVIGRESAKLEMEL